VESLLYLADNYEKYPDLDIINISGQEIFSYYLFWNGLNNYFEFPGTVKPRREKLENETPRPFRAGLNITQSKRLGFPLHSMTEGFELLKQGVKSGMNNVKSVHGVEDFPPSRQAEPD